MPLQHIEYRNLNARQQENYNYQKVAGILADYGFVTMRLSDDWNGADFLAIPVSGTPLLRVQLKGRLAFAKKYVDQDIHICFPSRGDWYLLPHDEVLKEVDAAKHICGTESWQRDGSYHYPHIPEDLQPLLERFKIVPTA